MTRAELLKQLGLTDEELSTLVLKFRVFYASLTAPERAVVDRLLPRFRHAAGLFGGDVTRDELKVLIAPPPTVAAPAPSPAPGTAGAFGQNGLNQITNGDGDGNGNGS